MSLRFVFTAPRYHTNQHYAVKALLDAGHEVSFLALRRGAERRLMKCCTLRSWEKLTPVRLWMRNLARDEGR